MIDIELVQIIVRNYPLLKRALRTAHIKKTPQQFVKKNLMLASYAAGSFGLLFFFMFAKRIGLAKALFFSIVAFLISFFLIFVFTMQSPRGVISKRRREIDKEVLYAGRYLLVKMESGSPLFNSIIDASKGYGVGATYFKEIVDDIGTGTTIETALGNAREYNASEKFKRILWQLIAAIKTGTDVTNALRSTLKIIADQQMIEIKGYGKKLNSLMLFYMVIACVAPSLGVTLFVLIASFLELDISSAHIFSVLFFMAVIQMVFIVLIKSARPAVDI